MDVPGYIHDPSANAQNGGELSGINDIAGRVSALYQPVESLNAILRVNWFNSNPQNYGVHAKDIPDGQGMGITPGALSYLGIPQSLYNTSGYTRAALGFFDSQINDSQRRTMTNQRRDLGILRRARQLPGRGQGLHLVERPSDSHDIVRPGVDLGLCAELVQPRVFHVNLQYRREPELLLCTTSLPPTFGAQATYRF